MASLNVEDEWQYIMDNGKAITPLDAPITVYETTDSTEPVDETDVIRILQQTDTHYIILKGIGITDTLQYVAKSNIDLSSALVDSIPAQER